MLRNGEPYIPTYPLCPIERTEGGCRITPDNFDLHIDDVAQHHRPPRDRTTDILGVFYTEDPDDLRSVGTEVLRVQKDSPLADAARSIDPRKRGDLVNRRAGELFCNRVMNCRGITEDGECWALGSKAVAAVVKQLAKEMDNSSAERA